MCSGRAECNADWKVGRSVGWIEAVFGVWGDDPSPAAPAFVDQACGDRAVQQDDATTSATFQASVQP